MDGNAAPFTSPPESDFSSGYLEDALVEFRDRTKRRRMLSYTDDHTDDDGFKDLEQVFLLSIFPHGIFTDSQRLRITVFNHIQSHWNSNSSWGMSENIYSLSQINSIDGFSGNYVRLINLPKFKFFL